MNFTFDGNISREVLENYLSRSVTAAGLFESETLEDDLRAIRNGCKISWSGFGHLVHGDG